MKNTTKIESIDGYDDFGHFYVCIEHLVKPLGCSISYLEKMTGLNYRTLSKLIDGENQRTIEHKTIEKICFCFNCKPEDFCYYIPPKN